MHRIDRIEVDGFWDTHDLVVDLHPDVTFLIGPNGTGKTTLINLLAAALLADFPTLGRLPFRSLRITLSSPARDKRPTITVSKKRAKERVFEFIEYKIKRSEDGPERRFFLEGTEDPFYIRRHEFHPRYERGFYRTAIFDLPGELQKLVNVSWLSVHRTAIRDRTSEERRFESTVDQKLYELSNKLVRYFSALGTQKDEEILKFQQMIFLSLLRPSGAGDSLKTWPAADIGMHREAIGEIFDELKISSDKAGVVESYFDEFLKLHEKLAKDGVDITAADIFLLMSADRIRDIVKEWQELGKKIAQIFSNRDRFQSIVNSMLQRKRMEIDDSNELTFVSRSEKRLAPQMLSSGEKQLLILLSEALLQRQQPYIFMADEPELSLHVSWQEKLVSSLRELNSSAQIIAATHSPDIVGQLSSRAISMEDIIP